MTTQPPLTIDLVQRQARAFIDRDAKCSCGNVARAAAVRRHQSGVWGWARLHCGQASCVHERSGSIELRLVLEGAGLRRTSGTWVVIVDRVPGFKKA